MTIVSRLLLMVVVVACGCGAPRPEPSTDYNHGAEPGEVPTAANSPSPIPETVPHPGTFAGEWSEPVNGLSARLLVTLKDGTHSSLWASSVVLEIKNTYSTPLAFIDQPEFTDVAVRDSKGRPLPESSYAGNQITGEPQWAIIAGNTYLGIRVDTSIPVHHGICVGLITPEACRLAATLVSQQRNGPENQWIGEIQVPPVSLTSKGTGP